MAFYKDHKVVISIVAILAIIGLATGGYFFWQYQQAQKLLQNPTLAAQQQVDSLISQVGKLIALPKDETPTIATVSDATKLQNQAFFANAKNGDKVLIYTKNRKAILYDPVANIIVDVAPVNIAAPTASVSLTPTPTKKATPTPTPSKNK